VVAPLRSRQSIRLSGFDYSQRGWYFITICTYRRKYFFGDIVGANNHSPTYMQLSNIGNIVYTTWKHIPDHYPNVKLDKFIVMPNHVHGIINIYQSDHRANNNLPLHGTSQTIGAIIRGFKIGVTKWCRTYTITNNVWQRNYYEHIIRDDHDLRRIRQYIANNVINWANDNFYNPRRGE